MSTEPDVVLIGAGIMSSTVGVFLKELEPSFSIAMFETLEDCALESSEAWNNAGTGHAANCEMNYTPERPDGTVDISKALEVNVEFDLSRQFWTYLVKKGAIADPRSFIHPVPHMSFVHDAGNVAFLKKRYAAMSAHHCYEGMEYSEDRGQIAGWVPLVMEGRAADEPVAVTRIISGTDVDYGALTHHLVHHLGGQPGCSVHYKTRVTNLVRADNKRWRVEVQDLDSRERRSVTAKFVFIGAGGGALPLLQKSGIPEGHGYAALLDLVESIRPANIEPLLAVARDNFDLTEYLIEQVLQSESHRLATLDEYYPKADPKDWRLQVAGQRVQIIKPDVKRGGLLEFGTELVGAADSSLVALLGASPGASTAAFIAIGVLQKCFASELTEQAWLPKLKEMIPSYGISLIEDAAFTRKIRSETARALKIEDVNSKSMQAQDRTAAAR